MARGLQILGGRLARTGTGRCPTDRAQVRSAMDLSYPAETEPFGRDRQWLADNCPKAGAPPASP